jgi:peptide/nickel transport system substrate-binding protein
MKNKSMLSLLLAFALLLGISLPVVKADETVQSSPIKIGAMFSPDDTLDPVTVTSPGGMLLMMSLYDSMVSMHPDGPILRMAESIEANDTLDAYTITLQEGLVYSDGTEVTGQDIIDSLRYIAASPHYQSMYGNVDIEKSTAEGNQATIVLKEPTSDFVESVLAMWSPVAPGGEFKGIGAGGFVLEKGDPQTGYVLVANEKYYAGKPSIPEVTILNIPDSHSKASALQTGEIDYAWGLDASAVQTLLKNEDIELPSGSLDGAVSMELVLNTRVEPFNDPEVRRAAKLTVDREKMVAVLLGNYGEVANDMLGKGFVTYPEGIEQTKANKEEAKKIFQEKGVTEFTIVASDTVPGMINAVKMMAQEFAEVGVTVVIEELDPQTFFAQMGDLFQKSAFTFYWMNRAPLAEFRSQVLKDSPYNVSGYTSDVIEENFKMALSTSDRAEIEKCVHAISKDIHDNGGELIWGYQKDITAHRKGLKTELNQTVPWLATATFVPEQ